MKAIGNQIVYFGLGLWDFGKEKLERLFAEITKRGELRREDDPHAADSMTDRFKRGQAVLWDKTGAIAKKVLPEAGLARRKDLEALQKRVASLEEELRGRPTDADQNS